MKEIKRKETFMTKQTYIWNLLVEDEETFVGVYFLHNPDKLPGGEDLTKQQWDAMKREREREVLYEQETKRALGRDV